MSAMRNEVKRLHEQARAAKYASRQLATLGTEVKNRALLNVALALEERKAEILAANKLDCELNKSAGLSVEMLGRLELSSDGFSGMVATPVVHRRSVWLNHVLRQALSPDGCPTLGVVNFRRKSTNRRVVP